MNLKNIKIKDIQDVDTQFSFFHYTNKNNIESIDINGLLPKIGNSATGIEKSEKIFFAIGEKGVFSIFDSWIRWLIAKRITDLPGEKADIPFLSFLYLYNAFADNSSFGINCCKYNSRDRI